MADLILSSYLELVDYITRMTLPELLWSQIKNLESTEAALIFQTKHSIFFF